MESIETPEHVGTRYPSPTLRPPLPDAACTAVTVIPLAVTAVAYVPYARVMEFSEGDLVRLGDGGVSVFRVVGPSDDGRVLVEPVAESAANQFPMPYRAEWLRPASSG